MLARAKVVSCPDPMTGMKRSAQINHPTGVSLARLGKPSRDGFSNLAKKKLPKKICRAGFLRKGQDPERGEQTVSFHAKTGTKDRKKITKKRIVYISKKFPDPVFG